MIFTCTPNAITGILCLFSATLFSQITTFQKTYGTPDQESATDIIETPDGYLIAGRTHRAADNTPLALLIRIDKNGSVLWQKTYGGTDEVGFESVAIANDGGFIAWGSIKKDGSSVSDAWLVKVDDDGNLLWQKTIGAPASSEFPTGQIVVMPDGYILSGTNPQSSFVIRVDNAGDILWSRITSNTGSSLMNAQYTADSLLYLAGGLNRHGTWSTMDLVSGTVKESVGFQTDSINYFYKMHRTPEGDHVMMGNAGEVILGKAWVKNWVQKVDANGQLIWSKKYSTSDRNIVPFSTMLPDGSLVISTNYYQTASGGPLFAAMIKLDKDGDLIWARSFRGLKTSELTRIIRTADGGLMAVGQVGNDNLDILLIKTDSLGAVAGCCVTNLPVTVEDACLTTFKEPVSTTAYDSLVPYESDFAGDGDLEAGDFCFNQPFIEVGQTIRFCDGQTVTIGGITYNQSGIVTDTLPAADNACRTIVRYALEQQPKHLLQYTISFCPGETVTIGGIPYSQPGTVTLNIPSTTCGVCDTQSIYTLNWLNQPTISRTIAFCPGESVLLGGTSYSQPGTVSLVLPATAGGCDTLATYTLEYETAGQQSTLQLTCPENMDIVVPAGITAVPVVYQLPGALSDCTCPELLIGLNTGGASGDLFPLGINTVCYRAEDACGSEKTCCFTIRVDRESVCDTKTNGCLKFELVSVDRDAGQNWVYRIRLTNNCSAEMTYAYIQLPTGVQAITPANNSLYTSPGGLTYIVRNPNFTPFYSLRFKPESTGLVNGQSDIFWYVLPAQTKPDYIQVAARLLSGAYVEAHLNTFYCPVGTETANKPAARINERAAPPTAAMLHVFPNPATEGTILTIAGGDFPDGMFLLQDLAGRLVMERRIVDNQVFLDKADLSLGLYFFKILDNNRFAGSGKLIME